MKPFFTAVVLSAFVVIPGALADGPNCSDPWVTQALKSLGRGSAADRGNQGLCNINRYRGGQWDNQAQLNDAVRHSFDCNDPWIGEAYVEIRSAPPIGNGATSECNPATYGSWGSYADLKQKIAAHLQSLHSRRIHDYSHGASSFTVDTIVTDNDAYIFVPSAANVIAETPGSYRIQLPDQTFHVTGVISDDGHSFHPAAGASIVAQGGGNIVAAGAGNLITENGAGLISQDGGSIMRAIAAIVAQGAGNVVSTNSGNLAPTISSLMQNMANYVPDASSFSGGNAFAFSNGSSSSDILPLAAGGGRTAYTQALKDAIARCGEANVEFAIPLGHSKYAYAALSDVPPAQFGTARSRIEGYVCKSNASGWPHYSGPWTAAATVHLNLHDSAPGDPQGFFLITQRNDAYHFGVHAARLTKQPNGSYFATLPDVFLTMAPDGTMTINGAAVTSAGVGTLTADGLSATARVVPTPQLAKMIVANGIVTNATPITATHPAPTPPPAPAPVLSTLDYAEIERTHGDLRTTREILAANGMVPFSSAYRPSDLPLMFMQSTRDVAAYRHGDKGPCGGYVMILNGNKYAERIPAALLPQVISFACKGDAIAAGFTHF